MSRLRRIIKNTVISLLGQALSMISGLLLSFAYGHFLGAFAFGELYFAVTFVNFIGTPIETGYSNQTIRDVAQKPEIASRYFSNVLLIKLGTWLIVFAAILLISWLLRYTSEVRTLIAICGFDLLVNALATAFASLHYAFERTIHPVVGNILEKSLSALLGFLLLKSGAGVQVMATVMVGGSLINAIWQAIWYFRTVGFCFVIDIKLIREIVRTNIPFFIVGLMGVGYSSIDTVLLSLMTNSTVVGLYGAAARITDMTGFLPNIVIMNIMYPVFAKLDTSSDTELKLALEKSINLMLFCSIPIATLLIVAAPNIIGFLYGSGFIGAVPALQGLAPYVIFLYVNYALLALILTRKQDRTFPIASGVAFAFNLGLNLALIPHFQQRGPAIVTSLTELLLCCITVFIIPRRLLSIGSLRVAFKALIASLLMAIVILPLHTLHIFVILPIAMLVYLVAAFLLGVIPREDYLAVYNAFFRKVQRSSSLQTGQISAIPAFTYDLPTIPLPAFFGSIAFEGTENTLLDIQMAVTNQLPIIRLPQASQRTGLLTRHLLDSSSSGLSDTPLPYCTLKSEHPYYDEPFDVSQSEIGIVPVMYPHVEQPVSLKSTSLLPTQPHSPMKQERYASSLQRYASQYGENER